MIPFFPIPAASVTLDPSTAHPRLRLSAARRSRQFPAIPKESQGGCSVLGVPGFRRGRHYWEVEVAGRRGWALGAATGSRSHVWCVGIPGIPGMPGMPRRRLALYLDYERGRLGIYEAESMSPIHTFPICS